VSDWSKRMAQNIRRTEESIGAGNARALQVGQLLDSMAPDKWKELRDMITQKCTEFNAEPEMNRRLVYDTSKPEALIVENIKNHKEFRVLFDRERHRVSASGAVEAAYQICVKDGSRELYFAEITRKGLGQSGIAPERIAEDVITAFLQSLG
jgi:hypothetical protein